MPIQSLNPATGELLRTFSPLSEEEIEGKIALASDVFGRHRRTAFAERSAKMIGAAEVLEKEKDRFGSIMTAEMGKPIAAAVAEAEKCAKVCRYYAEKAEQFLAAEDVKTEAARSYIRFDPLGPVLAVMPWNFPFWQVFRFAAPAIMAGNVGLLKHSSNVPQCALAIEEIFQRAGFEEGVFQTLLIGSDQVGRVLNDDRIVAATLTGSERAGKDVAAKAGAKIKKTVLELGGSDPFIVTGKADLAAAVETAVKARVINNGQSCIAAKRFIVFDDVAGEFQEKFVEAMKKLRIGDPTDRSVDVGPLATQSIADDLERQVDESVKKGARVLTGGKRLRDKGPNYYEPTVLTDIPHDAPAYSEELFGPVASLFPVRSIDEAITLANDTTFGLGASVWSRDQDEQKRFIEEIETGQVFINAMVASDPRLPFGGVKHSGYGRELGVFGIREFVNVKTIYIAGQATDKGSSTE